MFARRPNQSQRASMYVAVLTTALLVSVIGLSALTVVRVQNRGAQGTNDLGAARLYAQAGIELGLHWINQDPNWRDNRPNGVWATDVPIGGGAFTLLGTDPDALALNDDPNDPLVVTSTGVKGDARYKLQVTLVPQARGLACLEVALHADNNLIFDSAVVQCDQTISANNSVIASSSNIFADVEAVIAISGGTYWGLRTVAVSSRTMPDPATVFDFYKDPANGTYIDIAHLPLNGGSRYIDTQVLSPATNPYGSGETNPQGIYVIDCLGEKISLQNCRIVGTLVLFNFTACEVFTVNWEPAVANYPALMVQGNAEFHCNAAWALEEGPPLSFNFNPAGTSYPYPGGESDSVQDDAYPVVIKGLVYVSGDVNTWQSPAFDGAVVVGNTMTANTNLDLTYQSTFFNNPPPGFGEPPKMVVSPGSWRQVVD